MGNIITRCVCSYYYNDQEYITITSWPRVDLFQTIACNHFLNYLATGALTLQINHAISAKLPCRLKFCLVLMTPRTSDLSSLDD